MKVSSHVLRHTLLRKVANEKGLHYAMELFGHRSDRYTWRRFVSSLPYPICYDIDPQAELNDERYEQALKALGPSDVLATVDDLVAQILNARDHPLYALMAHCLQYGTTKSSGKRPYVSAMVGVSYEPLIDEAIARLVKKQTHAGHSSL